VYSGDWAIFAYLYGPVAVLLLSNTVMFAFTIRHLVKHDQETAVIRENKRSAAQTKKRSSYLLLDDVHNHLIPYNNNLYTVKPQFTYSSVHVLSI
jgi:hypothetical protein